MLPNLSRRFFSAASRGSFSSQAIKEPKSLKVISLGGEGVSFDLFHKASFYSMQEAADKMRISITPKEIKEKQSEELSGQDICRALLTIPRVVDQFMAQFDRLPVKEDALTLYGYYLAFQRINILRCEPAPGFIEFLSELIRKNIKVTLHTRYSRQEANILKRRLLNIDKNILFHSMTTYSDVVCQETGTKNFFLRHFELTTREHGIVPEEMLVIGDRWSIEAAHKTGHVGIGIVGLNQDTTLSPVYLEKRAELVNNGASYVASFLTDAIRYVEEYEKHLTQLAEADTHQEHQAPAPRP